MLIFKKKFIYISSFLWRSLLLLNRHFFVIISTFHINYAARSLFSRREDNELFILTMIKREFEKTHIINHHYMKNTQHSIPIGNVENKTLVRTFLIQQKHHSGPEYITRLWHAKRRFGSSATTSSTYLRIGRSTTTHSDEWSMDHGGSGQPEMALGAYNDNLWRSKAFIVRCWMLWMTVFFCVVESWSRWYCLGK